MQINEKDLKALVSYARKGADDVANQIIDEIVYRVNEDEV